MVDFLAYFKDQKQAMVDLVTALVNIESPSRDKVATDKLGAYLEGQFKALGASSVTTFPRETVGDIKLAKWNEDADGKPILLLMHIDTVWPLGTLAERPVTIDEDGRLFGPGAIDMKSGVVVALTAIRGLTELDAMPERPIWILMTTDEEIGSKQSRDVIEECAKDACLVLVMEPATPDGALKVWRKGVATYRVHVEGRASHAGNAPEEGINAIVELAQQILKINAMNDLRHGTSVSVTMLDGGSAGNVIPAKASAYIDTRVLTQRAMDDLREQLRGLESMTPGATVTLEEIHSRPPMEYTDNTRQALAQVYKVAEKIGVTVREEGAGGGSDGNYTAALGIPTIDGLGPQGDGLHALHEHVLINTMPQRAALLAGILRDWEA